MSAVIGDAGESAGVSQESGATPSASLRGLRVVFTGQMVPYPAPPTTGRKTRGYQAAFIAALEADQLERQRLRERATAAGAIAEADVCHETDLLVVGKEWGSKLLRVRENVARGVAKTAVVTPDRFRAMLKDAGA